MQRGLVCARLLRHNIRNWDLPFMFCPNKSVLYKILYIKIFIPLHHSHEPVLMYKWNAHIHSYNASRKKYNVLAVCVCLSLSLIARHSHSIAWDWRGPRLSVTLSFIVTVAPLWTLSLVTHRNRYSRLEYIHTYRVCDSCVSVWTPQDENPSRANGFPIGERLPRTSWRNGGVPKPLVNTTTRDARDDDRSR